MAALVTGDSVAGSPFLTPKAAGMAIVVVRPPTGLTNPPVVRERHLRTPRPVAIELARR